MELINMLIALAVCISVHEASHALIAYKLGDPTAKHEGRVSLNPMRHLDVLGTIMIFIAHFGWGKPVPINYYNLKHPKRDAALISIAGPVSNLLTAFLIGFLFKYIPHMPSLLLGMLRAIYSLSIVLFIFNLLPIPPLDGSKLLGLIIPKSKEVWYQNFISKGPMYLIIIIIADRLISEVTGFSFFAYFLQFFYEIITMLIFLAT
jgi:Zn-dependent protease